MSSETFPMKTQLQSGDRRNLVLGNLALVNLPKVDITGGICLTVGDRYSSYHPSLFLTAHLSDSRVVYFPQQPFCLSSDNVSVWALALRSMKKVEPQKRNSQRLSQDHAMAGWSAWKVCQTSSGATQANVLSQKKKKTECSVSVRSRRTTG